MLLGEQRGHQGPVDREFRPGRALEGKDGGRGTGVHARAYFALGDQKLFAGTNGAMGISS